MNNTVNELQNINQTLKKIVEKMPEPDNPFVRGMIIAGLAVSIFGILQGIDIILNWIRG